MLEIYYWNNSADMPGDKRRRPKVVANGVDISNLISSMDLGDLHTLITLTVPSKMVHIHSDKELPE